MQSLTILGSTGSIGQSTVSLVSQHIDKFRIYALVSDKNVIEMTKQCLATCPKYVCMINIDAAKMLKSNLIFNGNNSTQVLSGMECACELTECDDVDMVMSSMSGIFGLKPTFSAIRSGKKILLANKETLITCGTLLIEEIYKYHASLLPIDSEHNAIFQCLPMQCQQNLGRIPISKYGISRIVLTTSGGSLLNIPRSQLSTIKPEQVCTHPNWFTGQKMAVNSATMMNKGLEYIEACILFGVSAHEIEISLHPQSIVHAIVHYSDGTMLVHLAPADMKIPILYAMTYPKRLKLSSSFNIDINIFNKLNFDILDIKNYPCFQLALDANNDSQSAIIILNAANEVAVDFFLNKKISFLKISDIIRQVLDEINFNDPKTIDEILYIDKRSRERAKLICSSC